MWLDLVGLSQKERKTGADTEVYQLIDPSSESKGWLISMICDTCGKQYNGDECQHCKEQGRLPQAPAANSEFHQYDYYPNQQQLQHMDMKPHVASLMPASSDVTVSNGNAGEFGERAWKNGSNGSARHAEWQQGSVGYSSGFASNHAGVCPQCGAMMNGTACGKCGYTMGQRSAWADGGADELNQMPSPENKALPVALGIVTFFVIVAAVIGGFIALAALIWGHAPRLDFDLYFEPPFGHYDSYSGSYSEDNGYSESYDEYSQYDEYASSEGASNDVFPSGISRQEYLMLELGMSYDQISAIIGGDGTIIENNDNGFTVMWSGERNTDARVIIAFMDGEAIDIRQKDLLD